MLNITFHPFRLTFVNTSGIDDRSRGATINYQLSTSRVYIMPNDDPFGVVSWKYNMVVTSQLTEQQSRVALLVQRAGGTFGTILVSYRTTVINQTALGPNEQPAQPGEHFTSVSSDHVTLEEGIREAFVLVEIHHVSFKAWYLIWSIYF